MLKNTSRYTQTRWPRHGDQKFRRFTNVRRGAMDAFTITTRWRVSILFGVVASVSRITSKTGRDHHNGVYHVSLVHPPAIPILLRSESLARRRSCFIPFILYEIETANRQNESSESVLWHDCRQRAIGSHHDWGKRILRKLFSGRRRFLVSLTRLQRVRSDFFCSHHKGACVSR